MAASFQRHRVFCFLAATLVAASFRAARAQEAVQPTTEGETASTGSEAVIPPGKPIARPAHLIVLRLPVATLTAQIDRQIDFQTPVRDVILGTPVSGVARLVGRPQVKLEPSEGRARFNVVFTGTVYSRTVGHSGPAIIHGHSVTRFTATKEVVFEPGQGFHANPPVLQSTTQCYTDRIDSTRGGLIGQIVQRRAAGEIASKQPTLTAIARERAKERIAAAFEKHMEERLVRLNKAVEFQIALADFRTQDGNRRLRASTTDTHLELADVIHNNESAIDLPILAALGASKAPVEIWIHSSMVPTEVGAALETIFTNPDQSAVINALAVLPGTLGKKAATVVTALASENKVAIQNTGDWLLVQLTQEPAQVAAAPANRVRR